jgi:hypothetical protein
VDKRKSNHRGCFEQPYPRTTNKTIRDVSEGKVMNLKALQDEIRIARNSLRLAEDFENASGYDIDATMERKHCEGWLEALEYAHILMNGVAYNDED